MTDKCVKHPIWESSVRPLYPKCVWIDGGSYRNFILDHDIRRRQPADIAALNGLGDRRAISCDGLDEDLQSLKLIGLSSDVKEHYRRASHLSDSPFVGRVGDTMSRVPLLTGSRAVDTTSDKYGNRSCTDDMVCGMDREHSQLSAISKFDGECLGRAGSVGDDIDQSKNQLTERVLQWLDLAGRQTTMRSDFDCVPKKPPKRRISTASDVHNRRLSMTFASASAKNAPTPTAQLVPLKRVESVHHLSLTFNKDDVQQPLVPHTPSATIEGRTALRFGEFFPTTYRCSRKFLTYRNAGGQRARNLMMTQSRSMDQQMEPTATVGRSRRSLGKQPKRHDSIENQYRSMIQRQILETNFNTQLAKKQLHIFMPSLSKKTTVTTVMNGNGGDCDSCLSTILSSSVAR